MKIDPRFDNLRDDTGFQDLMQRMNFPRANYDGGHGLAVIDREVGVILVTATLIGIVAEVHWRRRILRWIR